LLNTIVSGQIVFHGTHLVVENCEMQIGVTKCVNRVNKCPFLQRFMQVRLGISKNCNIEPMVTSFEYDQRKLFLTSSFAVGAISRTLESSLLPNQAPLSLKQETRVH